MIWCMFYVIKSYASLFGCRRVPKLRYTFSVRPVHLWWTGLLTPFWLCQNGVYLNLGTSTKAGLAKRIGFADSFFKNFPPLAENSVPKVFDTFRANFQQSWKLA